MCFIRLIYQFEYRTNLGYVLNNQPTTKLWLIYNWREIKVKNTSSSAFLDYSQTVAVFHAHYPSFPWLKCKLALIVSVK